MEILTKHQRQIIQAYCTESGNSTVSRTYSGRGMYGKQCFGFDANQDKSPTTLLAELIEYALNEYGLVSHDDGSAFYDLRSFIELFTNHEMKQDNLGMGMIYYFPTLEWGDDTEDEDIGNAEPIDEDDAQDVLNDTRDAYSFDRYGDEEWLKAIKLLWSKYEDRFVIGEVLRSKWPRYCETPTAEALMEFINDPKNRCDLDELIG